MTTFCECRLFVFVRFMLHAFMNTPASYGLTPRGKLHLLTPVTATTRLLTLLLLFIHAHGYHSTFCGAKPEKGEVSLNDHSFVSEIRHKSLFIIYS